MNITVNWNGFQNTQNQTEKGVNALRKPTRSTGDAERDSVLEMKKKMAQKQAIKLVGDAWERDKKVAAGMSDMEAEKAQKWDERIEAITIKNGLPRQLEELKEEYHISDDSDEQKDLELLMKYQNNIEGMSHDSFSEEEIIRLKELQDADLTEYQKYAMEVNGAYIEYTQKELGAEDRITSLMQSETDAKIEQLKTKDMLKAKSAAEEIMQALSKDIYAYLMQDGVEKVEEKAAEAKEKEEKLQEEKEEKEEKLEEAKERREEEKEMIENSIEQKKIEATVIRHMSNMEETSHAQQKVQQIMKEKKLVNEDLKGIEINLNF